MAFQALCPSFLMLLLLESVYLTISSGFVLFYFDFLLAESGFNFENAEDHQEKVIKITTLFRLLNTSKPLAFIYSEFWSAPTVSTTKKLCVWNPAPDPGSVCDKKSLWQWWVGPVITWAPTQLFTHFPCSAGRKRKGREQGWQNSRVRTKTSNSLTKYCCVKTTLDLKDLIFNYNFGYVNKQTKDRTSKTPILPFCQAQLQTALLIPCHHSSYIQSLQRDSEEHGGRCSSFFLLILPFYDFPVLQSGSSADFSPFGDVPALPWNTSFPSNCGVPFVVYHYSSFHSSFFCSIIPSSDAFPLSIFCS